MNKNGYIKRGSGVLLPVSALPGNFSIGGFGREAIDFIDFLSDAGFTYWQVLPFCITDEYNSPYKSFSAFAGNPYFVSLDELYEKRLITRDELMGARQKTPYVCEYERLANERFALLRRAAGRLDDRREVEKFIDENPRISAACRFLALKSANGGLPWWEWTTENCDPDELFARQFVQYEFFTQWRRVKDHAAKKGIKMIGDLPIYVSCDSADVWENREIFLTDEKGRPSAVAGVPPDYFSADGQLWGNPLYDWEKLKKEDFSWWRERLKAQFELFDGLRLDHFRGFESYWSVPADAATAKEGHWEKGPGRDFVDMLLDVAGDRLIIAEDLGVITKDVNDLREYGGLPGMRVLQFAFLGDTDSPHLPHNYVNDCVAYTGTHDNNTLLGWVWELDDPTRRRMLDYFSYTGDWNACYATLIKGMLGSAAGVVIMPIQDLLGYGSDTRLNRPGQAEGNWAYRVTREQLASIDRRKFRHYNELYAR